MSAWIRKRLSFANTVSLLALFVALGGSSYAALKVGSKQITNNSVRSADLRNNDVRSRDVRDGTLMKGDFKAGQLPAGATGAQGPRGLKGEDGDPGTSVFESTIPSGTTVRGTFAINDVAKDTAGSAVAVSSVSFPVPTASVLGDTDINFKPSTQASDDDATCTGSAPSPTAPAGKVCLYPNQTAVADNTAAGLSSGTRFGFNIVGVGNASTPSRAFVAGSWAYTAP